MSYSIKEIFYTLQGEGANSGRPAVFCRFAGCNLWNGKESSRSQAICTFCDTDFVGTNGVGGGKFGSPEELANAIAAEWPRSSTRRRFVVCTGGEPLLQMDAPLVKALHDKCFEVAVETNGTVSPPPGIDWICVSPKAGAELQIKEGDELKLVYPQRDALPEKFSKLTFKHRYLQPMDGPFLAKNIQATLSYCLENPEWCLSLQTHKLIGIR